VLNALLFRPTMPRFHPGGCIRANGRTNARHAPDGGPPFTLRATERVLQTVEAAG
jgi:hypothetical protein